MKDRWFTEPVEMPSGFDSLWTIGKGLAWSLCISLIMHAILLLCAWPMSVHSPGFSSAAFNVQLVGNNSQKGKPAHGITPVVESVQRVVSARPAEASRSTSYLLPDKSSSARPDRLQKRLPDVSNKTLTTAVEHSNQAQASGGLASESGAANQSDGATSGASGGTDAARTVRQADRHAAGRGSHKDDLHRYRADPPTPSPRGLPPPRAPDRPPHPLPPVARAVVTPACSVCCADLIAVARGIKTYPTLARERGWEGTVEVELRFNASTRLSDVNTVRSGGHRLLDDQALETVRQAATSVPLPDSLASADFRLLLPVVFRLVE